MVSFRKITNILASIALIFMIITNSGDGMNYDDHDMDSCKESDYHYELTECDEENGRWRVRVPSHGMCTDTSPTAALRLTSCRIACDAGLYFDLGALTCKICPPGTYSLGGGVLYDNWNDFPDGFTSKVESFHSSFASNGRDGGGVNCSRFGWQPRGEFLASLGGPCAATLTYTVHLVKPGNLTYFYQYSDKEVIFDFEVHNDQCQSLSDSKEYRWPSATQEGQWKQQLVTLQQGQNVLQWKTIGMDLHKGKPVLLKMIEISGVAFASACNPCRPGTYSREGARSCYECSVNHFSPRQSSTCIPCNNVTEYAEKASSTCVKRKPCTAEDFYETRTPCDANNQTQRIWHWIEPKICRDDLPSATQLPSPSEKRACPPCNPGMDYMNGSTCSFCPRGTFSDGVSGCVACPASTTPNYAIDYNQWTVLPKLMNTACLESDGANCIGNLGWQPAGSYIHSGHRRNDEAYLLLSLYVSGFRNKGGVAGGKHTQVGRITFTFKMTCKHKCELVFMQGTDGKGVTVVESWSNSQPRQKYTHVIMRNDSYTFSWAFQKIADGLDDNMRPEDDIAKIFSIYVENTIDGGASMCLPCHQDSNFDERGSCIPCPPGEYVDVNTTNCTPCPENMTVSDPLAYGIESCQMCGPGLTSDDGVTCTTNCAFFIDRQTFDLRSFAVPTILKGSRLFTASGAVYYHMFNISLCGVTTAVCTNNASYPNEGQASRVHSFICRTTIVPNQWVEGDVLLSTQSVSLGDELVGVMKDQSFLDMQVIEEFRDKGRHDLNFYYSTPMATHACPQGRNTIITLHCDPNEKGNGSLRLPTNCPDGTCDGCTFNFLWASNKACPVCTAGDYRVVRGECESGTRALHLLAPPYCLMPSTLKSTRMETCSAHIPLELQIVISIVASLAISLCVGLLYFWKKTQHLTYKYMKLVQSATGHDGDGEPVLPPTESCALDDGEEEGEEIQFSRPRPGGILGRFMGKNIKPDTPQFETVQLTSQ